MPIALRWLLRLGPTNPIAVRLVQNGSRRQRHLYVRMGYLGVLVAVLLYTLLIHASGATASYQQLARAGSLAFTAVAYLQIGLICILAPVFMAGAIAQEADPRTWDILLTTPLGAGEIVLGNLFGRLFFILALLGASLPLFAVTQYFGGVPAGSIFASYLIAGCAALSVGSAAIALSVSRLVGRRAVFTFYIAVVTFLIVTIAIDGVLAPTGGGVTYMTALNPFLSLRALLDPTGYPRAAAGSTRGLASWMLESPVTTFCLLSAGVSAVLMLGSTITVRLGGLASLGPVRTSGKRVDGEEIASSKTRSAKSVWHNPIAWREAASRNATTGRVLARWSFIILGVLFGAGLLVAYHAGAIASASGFRAALLFTVMGELIVIVLVAINMSATCVSKEREDGTLDLILTTPITPGQYLSGKIKGIIAYLLPMICVPVLTLGLPGLYALAGGLGKPARASVAFTPIGGTSMTIPVVLPEAMLVSAMVLLPFIALCVVIGMNWSLKSKGTIGAVVWSVGIIAVLAGTVGVCAWGAASSVQTLGPTIGALSPASTVFALVRGEDAMERTVTTTGVGSARAALLVGAIVSALLHGAIVYALHASMTKNFDMTVRKLAGMK